MGHQVFAIDPAEKWLLKDPNVAEKYNDYYNSNVQYINTSIIDLKDFGKFDYITSISVLEHLTDTVLEKTLKKMAQLLKPIGSLILTVDYCPRNKKTRIDIINSIKMRISKRYTCWGFSFYDFKTKILPYLPMRVKLNDLIQQEKEATSYKQFWMSHSFEGCLYDRLRPYLSLGIFLQNELR